MPRLREIELIELIPSLPNVVPFRTDAFARESIDVFICALGFEDRATAFPEELARVEEIHARQAVVLEYSTNVEDNEANRPGLLRALREFCTDVVTVPCDEADFLLQLRRLLQTVMRAEEIPRVVFDISGCSAKTILLVMKVLLEFKLQLTLTYAEAGIYYPTQEEVRDQQPDPSSSDATLSTGVRFIVPSPEHPGNRGDALPDTVVVFPTFKPERTKAVLTEIDESLLTDNGNRVIWIVGKPRRAEDAWRAEAVRDVNEISANSIVYEATSHHYKDTLSILERIYRERELTSHLSIMPLGSKLQSVGVALFWQIRQDVSIIFAVPKSYRAKRYTESVGGMWVVEFAATHELTGIFSRVGQLVVEPE